MPLKLFARKPSARTATPGFGSRAGKDRSAQSAPPEDDRLGRDLQLERFGHVVRCRSQYSDHPRLAEAFRTALEAIDERFAIVPAGFVSLAQSTTEAPGSPETDIETEPFLLALCCVTNAEYQRFVDADGYQDLDLWPQDVWPHLIDFKDQTGAPAPRFWMEGRHDRRLADHPVVGLSVYEAAAYARWAGYRLPTGAEWQMAASWRIRSAAHVLRRYPWGDALDTRCCNLWASNVGTTVPVTAYAPGAAPNGVLQLIGNVWEWVASIYDVTDEQGRPVVGDMVLQEIRGGAVDTYFASQATSFFRTGLASLLRAHNVGFRCALDVNHADAAPGSQP